MTHYPKRLYLNGQVIPGDLHATNSVIVRDGDAEIEARKIGYRGAYEVIEEPIGGNDGSAVPVHVASTQDQGGVAAASADPVDELDALRKQAESLGIDVDRRWGEKRLRAEIAKAT